MRKRTRLTKWQRAHLNSPVCITWPFCDCRSSIVRWQNELEARVWSLEELAWIEDEIFYCCECAGRRCPEPETREYCARQYEELLTRRTKRECGGMVQ